MTRRPQLPVELYREIVQHVSPKENLFPLISTSRAFREEAARIVFKGIDISDDRDERNWRRYDLLASICGTVGIYVESLRIYCGARHNDAIRSILKSVPNLQQLGVQWDQTDVPLETFLPSAPAFRLRSLTTNDEPSPAFIGFLESQRMSLTLLTYDGHGNPDDFNFPFDFPVLEALCTDSPYLLHSMVARAPLSCLGCFSLSFLHEPLPTIRSLHVVTIAEDAKRLSTLFPNLRYLSCLMTFQDFDSFKQQILCPPTLEKLRLGINGSNCRTLAVNDIFEKASSLLVIVALFFPDREGPWAEAEYISTFKRGSKAVEEGTSDYLDGMDEWLEYRDAAYHNLTLA